MFFIWIKDFQYCRFYLYTIFLPFLSISYPNQCSLGLVSKTEKVIRSGLDIGLQRCSVSNKRCWSISKKSSFFFPSLYVKCISESTRHNTFLFLAQWCSFLCKSAKKLLYFSSEISVLVSLILLLEPHLFLVWQFSVTIPFNLFGKSSSTFPSSPNTVLFKTPRVGMWMFTKCENFCNHFRPDVATTAQRAKRNMSADKKVKYFAGSRSRIHERTILLRNLGIILRVLRLEVSVYNFYITNMV